MQKRLRVLLFVALTLSLVANLFQALWAQGADVVVEVTRPEVTAKIEEFDAVHSAQWSKVWVDRPDLVIFETEDLITFRGLFGASPKRVIYIATE